MDKQRIGLTGNHLFNNVQRISGDKAAVLFDNLSPWEKMITIPIKHLHEGGELPKSKFLS